MKQRAGLPQLCDCRQGFTLIELLIVVAIILVLAGLILAGSGAVRRMARKVQISQRLQAVETGLREAIKTHGDGIAALHAAQDIPLRWAPLIEVLDDLRDESVWASGFEWNAQRDRCPPHLIHIHGNSIQGSRDTWHVIHWQYAGDWTPDSDRKFSSKYGERLDSTLEAKPDRSLAPNRPYPSWYRARWPTIWPTVDWTSDEGPVVIGSPWGKPQLSPNGTPVTDGSRIALHLGQFTPLRSAQLLQFAGLLPAGAAGLEAFRSDRDPRQPWNDPFGNPLILAGAAFLPNRLDAWEPAGSGQTSKNRRDLILLAAREHYGSVRQAYIAVGSAGPVLATALPASWAEADDATALRGLWTQISSLCQAERWNEQGFETRPWKGLAEGKGPNRQHAFLGEPVIYE